jgi:hypothetical protein
MSIEKITKIANSLANQIDNSEKILAPSLALKLSRAAEAYPHDPTIVGIASVMNKYADKNTFISKGDFKGLYQKFYSRNTKFAELFQNEIGEQVQLMQPKIAERVDETKEIKMDHLADQVLLNALESVFDNKSLKMYARDMAEGAKKIVASTLDAWNLNPSTLTVDDGNEKFIVVRAGYETPKGVTNFYVPVEIVGKGVTSPTVFVGNGTTHDLNNQNVKNYIRQAAGVKLKLSATNILDALTKAASEDREISDTELALARFNASRQQKEEFFANQILAQNVEAEVKEIQLPKYSEYSHLEAKFTSPYGIAAFNLGEDKVKLGREVVARNLHSFGAKNGQVTVADSNNNTVFYAVSLDSGKVAFTVPVKIESGKVQPPSIMICQGSVNSFDAKGIRSLYTTNTTDYKAAAVASANYNLKSSDLIDNVRVAMEEGNLAKAEDALNVLATKGDAAAYATGFKVYASGLKGEKRDDISNHPMYNENDFYITSASKVPVSKQAGLPINKIYIDENGNHRPLYRRAMNENYQGGFFMNYKIFG